MQNKRRSRRRLAVRKTLPIVVLALALAVGVYLLSGVLLKVPEEPAVRGTLEKDPTIVWRGNTYTAKKRISTILFIGVDQTDEAVESAGSYGRQGGQADFLFLLAVDDENKAVYPIHIDRDTITTVSVTNMMGKPAGTTTAQICLSYAFGTSPAQGCELVQTAVSELLNGLRVNYYLSANMDAIGQINDAAGGVTVLVNEDLTQLDPAFEKDKEVTLMGDQAEAFVRARRSVGSGTNEERMARQRAYLNGLRAAVLEGVKTGGETYAEGLLQVVDKLAVKNTPANYLLDTLFKAKDYAWHDIITMAGQHEVGQSGYMEFHADPAGIEEMVIGLYFKPVQAD